MELFCQSLEVSWHFHLHRKHLNAGYHVLYWLWQSRAAVPRAALQRILCSCAALLEKGPSESPLHFSWPSQLVCSCVLQAQPLVSTGKENLPCFPLRSGFSFFFPQLLSLAVTTSGSGVLQGAWSWSGTAVSGSASLPGPHSCGTM